MGSLPEVGVASLRGKGLTGFRGSVQQWLLLGFLKYGSWCVGLRGMGASTIYRRDLMELRCLRVWEAERHSKCVCVCVCQPHPAAGSEPGQVPVRPTLGLCKVTVSFWAVPGLGLCLGIPIMLSAAPRTTFPWLLCLFKNSFHGVPLPSCCFWLVH